MTLDNPAEGGIDSLLYFYSDNAIVGVFGRGKEGGQWL